jgi:hypothetical protein
MRQRLADALGLAAILFVLLDLMRPSLLLLPTIAAGGDTPCHYPTAVWFSEHLLPRLRLHGWYPGAYLGHPLLLYYFPLPFLAMSAIAPVLGMPVAFKIGTVLGIFALPLSTYASFRLMRFAFPTPLLGAAGALVFLYVEDNPIWGGTIASMLAGEFSYAYGLALALLFLALLHRARERGDGPWLPAAVLALAAFAHGYAVLWAGLSATYVLYPERRPLRALGWLLAVAALSFALAGPALVPLIADWGWTTPYDDAWITVSMAGLLPPLLVPLFLFAAAGLACTCASRLRRLVLGRLDGCVDHRLLLLGHAAVVGAALAAAGPALGVIDVRFVPFAHLALALAGAATLGLLVARMALSDVAALGLALLAVVHADSRSHVLRSWIDWNYSGLETKELWPAWRELNDRLRGGVGDPRVEVEYGTVHERAGSIRMYETLPFFSGRSTLQGVYNQASLMTHPVYYLSSELFASSPNPFRRRTYSRFDPGTALRRLRLFNVGEIVAVSPSLCSALDARADVVRVGRIPPYTLYRLTDPGPGYVEPLAFAPVRSPLRGWRDRAYRWLTRKPPNRAHLVFTSDPGFTTVERDPWAPPPEVPLPPGVEVTENVAAESIRITTSRPGHPLLVKVSYHPRWRAEGADGPYLVSPGLMLIVPRQREVRLEYAARTWADRLGLALAAGALGVVALKAARRRVRRRDTAPEPGSAEEAARPDGGRWRWGGAMPGLVVVVLAAARFAAPRAGAPIDLAVLDERASRAYARERWEEAAEYARHAVDLARADDPRRPERLCLRGESLLRAGHPREAAEEFAAVVNEAPGDPHRPQALFSGALAREAGGDAAGAAAWRRQLAEEFPATPWAERLRRGLGAGGRAAR